MLSGLVAYPSAMEDVGQVIEATLRRLHEKNIHSDLESWTELDVPGHVIASTVLERLDRGNVLVADVTTLNFNIVFEIGYAIGKKKRILLIRYGQLKEDPDIRTVGIFDTLGYVTYTGTNVLETILTEFDDTDAALGFDPGHANMAAPVYLVLPEVKGDFETRLIARVKKARLFYRSFDPQESGRMSAIDAIQDVASSLGVVVPLLPSDSTRTQPAGGLCCGAHAGDGQATTADSAGR